ncbi:MAG TPA: tetratricopeptide repeat protein [Vicinamibacteria bacterium]|nr:tetratricopeptide repeat protein [Vicinamibacteria bacterium]
MADNTRIDELRRRLDKEPGSRLFAQLAEELRKEGELSDAIRVARTGLLQHPAYTSAHMTLGRAYLDTGDLAGARAQFEAVLRGAPDNILASRFLGETLEAMGDLGSALLQYRATLRLAPGDRQVESQIRVLEERLGAPTLRKATPPPPPAAARPPLPPGPTAMAEAPAPPVAREPSPVEEPPLPPAAPPMEAPRAAEPTSAPAPPPVPFTPPSEVSFDLEAPFEAAPEAPGPVASAVPSPPEPPPPPPPPAAPPLETPRAVEPPPAPPLPLDIPFTPATEVSFDLEAPFETRGGAPLAPEPSPGRRLTDQGEAEARTVSPPVVAPFPREPLPPPREPDLIFEPEPTPVPPPPSETPGLSSSTLAELYFKQGFTEQAVEVYKELLQKEPENERLRARLAEITAVDRAPHGASPPTSGGPTADARAERRRVLEQTIARFEDMLAAIKRG